MAGSAATTRPRPEWCLGCNRLDSCHSALTLAYLVADLAATSAGHVAAVAGVLLHVGARLAADLAADGWQRNWQNSWGVCVCAGKGHQEHGLCS